MVQITIFSAHKGRIQPDKVFYFTLFGSFELVHPTVAQRLLAERRARRKPGPSSRRPFFLTIFGAGSIKAPTLAAEFVDLREGLQSGLISLNDWDRAMAEMSEGQASIASLTLFGGIDECKLPSENEEIESLALQRHLGNIPETT
ncbi:MAG: hypothetical protein ACE5EX_09640, partial [Phycisphaerae bacterium]